MAQLPKYKPSEAGYASMPRLTTAATQQQVSTNARLNEFLGEATKYFKSQAVEYATDTAIEDAIRNPITAEQLSQARQTGDNPIEKYLAGGTTYNNAITKVLGQQVAGELDLDLQKQQADILEQVRLGKIENPEEMLAQLKAPIQAQVEFFSGIDPEMALAYGANAARSAQTKYLQGNAIFGELKEQKAYANAEQTLKNYATDYNNYLKNYPDATVENKRIYKETIEKVATDTSFSMSRDQLKLKESLRDNLSQIEDEHVAKAIAVKYKGDNIDEVLKALPATKGSDADYFNGKNILEQSQFSNRIKNYLDIENSGLAAIRQQVTYDISNAKQYVQNGQLIDPALAKSINQNIDKDSIQYKEWQVIEGISKNVKIWNTSNVTALKETYDRMNSNRANVNIIQPIEEQITQNALGAYLDNLSTSLKKDPVGTIESRSGVQVKLDLSDSVALKEQVRSRRQTLDQYSPLYGLSKTESQANILTKEEATNFVSQYVKSDAATRVQLLRNLDDGLGENNSQAMVQLTAEGLPITAELSSFLQDPRKTEQFLSFDMPEEQKALKAYAEQNDTSYDKIRTAVRAELGPFEDVIMKGNQFNTGPAITKLDGIVNALAYHAISEMATKNIGEGEASKLAAGVINNNFVLTDDYFIPRLYNGRGVTTDKIENKANLLQRFYLDKFNPVPFKSNVSGVTEAQEKTAMTYNMKNNGVWRNTPDGTGLVFGIIMSGGAFAPIENAQGDQLKFNFDNLDYIVPNTDIPMNSSFVYNDAREMQKKSIKKLTGQ
tara:strand:+ start:3305 stop:5641 length:2337 start_codon:yes stop_codon:yes gene_type:complete